ncbi:MatE protein [Anaerovirgula multivorans]|uniref:MatE protein n=1 Tax=Anaerovirgula multivorans TaxID=312168 RepID=A0A239D092_9FIRM|nr:MATE family efflux transporter [Anaerovirgula multivorans]SNS25875.1 MatE protein [Anaerovirgula multivorans]
MEFPKEKIGKEYDFVSLIKFAIPTIIMMVFMSVYTIIDGIYVSRFVSTSALSAINIVYPMNSIILAIGLMLATGGSAVIAKKMGEDKLQEAKENFTLIIAFGSIIGFIIMILGHVFINPMLKMLGAGGNEELFKFSFNYLTVLLYFSPLAVLQMIFQSFFIVAGKPSVGLTITLLGGCVNIVFDYIFIVPLQMGIIGAAVATGIGMAIPVVFGLIYFTFYKKGILYFVKLKKVSAIISFMRTFVFISVSLLLLPLIIGVKGVWLAVPITELFSMVMCIIYLNGHKKSYNYV